jgi:hypothetical protein
VEQVAPNVGIKRVTVNERVDTTVGVRRRVCEPSLRDEPGERGERGSLVDARLAIVRVAEILEVEG